MNKVISFIHNNVLFKVEGDFASASTHELEFIQKVVGEFQKQRKQLGLNLEENCHFLAGGLRSLFLQLGNSKVGFNEKLTMTFLSGIFNAQVLNFSLSAQVVQDTLQITDNRKFFIFWEQAKSEGFVVDDKLTLNVADGIYSQQCADLCRLISTIFPGKMGGKESRTRADFFNDLYKTTIKSPQDINSYMPTKYADDVFGGRYLNHKINVIQYQGMWFAVDLTWSQMPGERAENGLIIVAKTKDELLTKVKDKYLPAVFSVKPKEIRGVSFEDTWQFLLQAKISSDVVDCSYQETIPGNSTLSELPFMESRMRPMEKSFEPLTVDSMDIPFLKSKENMLQDKKLNVYRTQRQFSDGASKIYIEELKPGLYDELLQNINEQSDSKGKIQAGLKRISRQIKNSGWESIPNILRVVYLLGTLQLAEEYLQPSGLKLHKAEAALAEVKALHYQDYLQGCDQRIAVVGQRILEAQNANSAKTSESFFQKYWESMKGILNYR